MTPTPSEALQGKLATILARLKDAYGDQLLCHHLKSGKAYSVQGVALVEATLEVVVVYNPVSYPGLVFTRPWAEFLQKFSV